ncbi:hypothetical protein [Luteolibacter soli]|uniref:Uncharacterized protein n=1 Tax=Luteolibacter soli TaxID=3135280 RepID=A0ABU9AWW7_9BACT
MRFVVCAVLGWMCVGWSARGEGEKLTVGEIVLKDAVVMENWSEAAGREQPVTGRFEAAVDAGSRAVKAAVIVGNEKVTVDAGGKPVNFQLRPGDFVGSVVWTSNDSVALVVWNTRGVGLWLRYVLSVTVDAEGGIKHRLVMANQIAGKLSVLKLIAKEKEGVRARVRVSGDDRKVRYYEALLDLGALPDFSEKAVGLYGPKVER